MDITMDIAWILQPGILNCYISMVFTLLRLRLKMISPGGSKLVTEKHISFRTLLFSMYTLRNEFFIMKRAIS